MSLPDPVPGLAVTLSAAFLSFYSHTGYLAALADAGLWPEHIAGASSGALVAALAAAGRTPKEMMDWLVTREVRYAFHQWSRMAMAPIRRLTGFGTNGILDGERARAVLAAHLGDRRLEEFSRPTLAIPVTNLTTARAEIRTTGPLVETILASAALPVLFKARVIGEAACWDGGLAHTAPFGHWIGKSGIRIIAVHTVLNGPPAGIGDPARLGLIRALGQAHEAITAEFDDLRSQLVAHAGQSLVRHATAAPRPGLLFSVRRAWEYHAQGYRTGQTAATALRNQLSL